MEYLYIILRDVSSEKKNYKCYCCSFYSFKKNIVTAQNKTNSV